MVKKKSKSKKTDEKSGLEKSSIWDGLLLSKAMDFLIVIVGVTIAFQLNNLKQRSDQNSLEQFYLESLVTDIDKDITNINHILSELRSDSTLTTICLSRNEMVSRETLSYAVISILSFTTFSYRNDNTYSTLLNSHGLSIIRNKDTRNLISEYYKCYKSIDRFEYVYTEFLLSDFHPYFTSYIEYASGKISNPAVLNDARTNNSLLIAGGQLNDGIATYKNALVKARELKRIIAGE